MTFEILPPWALFGLTAAALSACVLLLQERLKVNGYALAFWNKIACVAITAPFVFTFGFPENPTFYLFLSFGAVLWAISDIVLFTGIANVGAGAVSRLLPSSSILSFLLWFMIDPQLFHKYSAKPIIFGLIFLVLCAFSYCAFRMKKCEISMRAVRAIWFVIFAAVVGSLNAKFITTQANIDQGPYAYVFVEGLMMIALWALYLVIRKPVPLSTYINAWRDGLTIGFFTAMTVLMSVTAFFYVDNPAYIPAIKALDAVIILFIYRLWQQKAQGDLKAGLGIVACAVALIVLKAQI
ncbi:MAG: hypothetical protein AAF182_02395 [Pseudomonadota bacterium]